MAEQHLKDFDESLLLKYLNDFLLDGENKRLICNLRCVLTELSTGFARTSAFFVRLKGANANLYESFRKAIVDAELHRNSDSFQVAVPFTLFFLRGYAALANFLDKNDPKIPGDKRVQKALADLLKFLTNTSEQSVLFENKEKAEFEAGLAIKVAQHLLVPLAPHKTFVIDSNAGLQLKGCCADEQPMNGTIGDTSFGCHKGWHGRADILLMGDDIPLTIVEDPDNASIAETVSMSSDSSVEENKVDKFTAESISEVTAQTIVYSFVQHRKNPKSPNSLVPGIGIFSKKLIVNLYDCVEDILVTTGPVDLYAKIGHSKLNPRAIVMLWLGINHSLFGNKTPEKFKSYTAEFHGVVGPVQLEAYKNESEQPFIANSEERSLSQFIQELDEEVAGQEDVNDYVTEKICKSLSY